MLTLNDGRSELWQWDTGRRVTVDADCSQVHFSNKVFGRSIDVDVADGMAIIPDILLQTDKELTAWAFVGTAENGYTKISRVFKVNKRNKPADYVFTPNDQTTLAELVERLDKIEETQDPDAIKNAVEDYLEQNPIEAPVQSVNGQTGTVELTAEDVGAISKDDLQGATNEVLAQAKASGEFKGEPGQPGQPGKDGKDGAPGKDYILPVATPNRLGGVKPVEATDEMTQPVGVTQDGKLVTAPGGGSGGITPPATAEIGQTIVVKSVDENGKPTEWEATDLPVGGGGDGGFDEVLIDFTTEETVVEFQVPIPHELDSVIKNASEHFVYLYIPRNTEDTATSTVGKVSISFTTSWKQVLLSDLNAIPAPTETWTGEGCVLAFLRTYKTGVANIDKYTPTQYDCVSSIVDRNLTTKRITGALHLQPFVQLWTTNYFTVEGTQEMYKGTRFIFGVRR